MYANQNLQTKTGKVLNYLQSGNSIAWKQCLQFFKSSSLAQRIQLLRKHGYKIKSVLIKTKNGEYIARYTLIPTKENFKSLKELKRYVGLVENDLKCSEDLKVELKDFYKRYTK